MINQGGEPLAAGTRPTCTNDVAGVVFTAKQNQPGLSPRSTRCRGSRWRSAHREIDRSHGRVATPTIQVLPAAPSPPFPHAWLIERYITDRAGTPISPIATLGITNLAADQAGPAELAALVATTEASSRRTGGATPSTAKTTPAPAPDPNHA
jgi:hypothetical protein